MNKYCNIIDVDKTYTEGVFRPFRNFTIFDLALIIIMPYSSKEWFCTLHKCIESHIYSSLNIPSQKINKKGLFKKYLI
jgi:hypothetical protein